MDDRPDQTDEFDDAPGGDGGLRRRTFLKFAGAAAVIVASEPTFSDRANAQIIDVDDPSLPGIGPDLDFAPIYATGPTFLTMLRRPTDMVRLQVEGYNLRIVRTDPSNPRLRLVNASRDAGIIVTFPPQSLLEEALPAPAGSPASGSIDARLSGASRLSFVIRKGSVGSGIPYTIDSLLDWRSWLLNTTVLARSAEGDLVTSAAVLPRPQAPGPRETSIEVPWWLQISPNRHGGFVSASVPVIGEGSGNAELWHARFATRPGLGAAFGALSEEPSANRVIRAVWSPDPQLEQRLADPTSANAGGQPFVASLSQRDRVALIRLTSDPILPNSPTGRVTVPVDTLTLSSIGASFQAGRSFASASEISLKDWRHRSTFGRDQFVRVVDRGYLMPFGHSASLVTVTERKFVGNGTSRSAVLEQRTFLIVNESVVDHDRAESIPTNGRQLPFASVRLPGIVTPDISRSYLVSGNQNCFFPVVVGSGEDLLFHAIAVDRDGRSVDLLMAMAFVNGAIADGPLAGNPDRIAPIRAAWNAYQHPTRRWARLSGQRVAYAPALADRPGATSLTTQQIRFDVTPLADESLASLPGRRRFWASMATADIGLDEIAAVSGNPIGPRSITYDAVYRDIGFDSPSNAGGLWANISGAAIPLQFSRPANAADEPGVGSDRAGAVVTPDLSFSNLSRSVGVAAGVGNMLREGTFDPAAFFAGSGSPKLLGGITLASVIESVAVPAGAVAPPSAMTISTRRTADAIESSMFWTPTMKSDPAGIFTPGRFTLDAVVRTPLDGSSTSPSSRVDGELTDFTLNIPTGASPLLMIDLDRLRFSSRDGRQPVLDVDVGGVRFGGELEYIEKLSKYLNFGDGGIDITVLPDRIAIGLAIVLPNITLGVFALRNVRFVGGFDVPLTGEPVRIRFALSSRDDPFRLTVYGIGGGGYLAIAFGPDGLEALELGIEAGAEIALDLGVASGSVSAMIGVILMISQRDGVDVAEFVAYFRLNGSVSAGPVSVSITITLELGYQQRTKNGKTVRTLYGRGTLEIDLSVPLLPTPSVSVTIERSLKSDAADPTFGDQFALSDWNDYCNAYGAD